MDTVEGDTYHLLDFSKKGLSPEKARLHAQVLSEHGKEDYALSYFLKGSEAIPVPPFSANHFCFCSSS